MFMMGLERPQDELFWLTARFWRLHSSCPAQIAGPHVERPRSRKFAVTRLFHWSVAKDPEDVDKMIAALREAGDNPDM
jgi:hypothetical protein